MTMTKFKLNVLGTNSKTFTMFYRLFHLPVQLHLVLFLEVPLLFPARLRPLQNNAPSF